MDRYIRKYILGEARHIPQLKKQLMKLKERRQMIFDSSPPPPDGMPHGQGMSGDPTANKALRLEKIDARINHIERELKVFQEFEDSLDGVYKDIYKNTILKERNLEYNAMLSNYSLRNQGYIRAKMLDNIAERLDYFLDIDKLD